MQADQSYLVTTVDDWTPKMLADMLGVDVKTLMAANKGRHKGLTVHAKLQAGTDIFLHEDDDMGPAEDDAEVEAEADSAVEADAGRGGARACRQCTSPHLKGNHACSRGDDGSSCRSDGQESGAHSSRDPRWRTFFLSAPGTAR